MPHTTTISLTWAYILSYQTTTASQTPTITENKTTVPFSGNILFTAAASGGESPYTYNFMIYNPVTNALVASSGNTVSSTFTYSPASTGEYYANVTVTDSVPYSKNSTKVQFSVSAAQPSYLCAIGTQLTIFSNNATLANGPDTSSIWANATPTYDGNPGWTANIPGATWIWDSNVVTQPSDNQLVLFKRSFFVPGQVQNAILTIATDNDGNFGINSHRNKSWVTSDISYETATSFNVTNAIVSGNNLATFNVTNIGISGSTYEENPAGLLYNLTVCYKPATFNSSNVKVSIPNSVIYVGQNEIITATVSGGVLPYTSYSWTLDGEAAGLYSSSRCMLL